MAIDLQAAVAVNQKLGFARILIDSASKLAGDDSIPARHSQHAFLDGASGQLYDTVVFFLAEIAQEKNPRFQIERGTITCTVQQMQDAQITNSLLQEIDGLLHTPQSWLRELIDCKNNPQFLAALFSQQDQNQVENTGNNALLASDKNTSIGPLATLQNWLINIQNLIERQRSQALEE